MQTTATRSLDEQRTEFTNRRFLATPITGAFVWLVIGIISLFATDYVTVMAIFFGTGSIVYISMAVSKWTGENFIDKNRPKNTFDTLFFSTVAQAILVYAIAIPFFQINHNSLPFTVGILTGLMWLPFSWIIKHPIGIFHAVTRTIGCTVIWYILPELVFVAIPFFIVWIYLITIIALEKRWLKLNRTK